ncbi:PhzF family phenazine biosynthesis protein [Pseudonocardia sp. TRM90224]|uniref:PhzF family phenazine biosynthesis protein n=1 Tax=Pseudonocardia sp. TRM90224 TaxID=2812678 RepID=UPI001E593949|nr:PhzF family phenazine biosynthesis isomerase [Pseudonocardia sp. TRM90224]
MTTVLHYAAFTEDSKGGNMAGVVLDATGLPEATMLGLAADVGYSETAFVRPGDGLGHDGLGHDGPRHYGLRYFSPQAEVAFCGHATIATAVALADRDGPGEIVFDTAAGSVPVRVTTDGSGLTATLTSPPTHTRAAGPAVLTAALAALRLDPADLDARFPVHVANAGNDHLVLALRERTRLAALDYDYPALAALMAEHGWTTVQVVWADPTAPFGTRFESRNPFPPGGVVEDPATGASAAALGGYLRTLGLVALPARIEIRQGADMGRPSRLVVDVPATGDRVEVTGAAARTH